MRTPLRSFRLALRAPIKRWSATKTSNPSTKTATPAPISPPLVVYDGKFKSKLQWLRRVSLSSSVLSILGFPIAFQLGATGSIPLVGQLMIAGTAIFTSVSSTIFLQTITSPYVAQLSELQEYSHLPGPQRRFLAQRINLLGNLATTEFELKNVERVNSSMHPFATFCDTEKKQYYYIFDQDVKDATLKGKLGVP